MRERIYSFIMLTLVAIVFLYITFNITFAEDTLYITQAQDLKTLGLFRGTDNGFELERSPTRAEGAVMLVRLLGKEQFALDSSFSHPFADVPIWADPYVGYIYQHSLTNGMTNTIFGSSIPLSDIQFVTFVLRALGYDDKKNDFNYRDALEKSLEIGLLNEQEVSEIKKLPVFLRNNVALISYKSLTTSLKDTNKTLIEKLILDEEAVSFDLAIFLGLITVEGYTSEYGYIVNNFDEIVNVLINSLFQFDNEIKINISNYETLPNDDFEKAMNIALEFIKVNKGMWNILSSYSYSVTDIQVNVSLTYRYSKEYLDLHKQQLQTAKDKAQEIINNIIKPGMSEFEKELVIHDYIVNNTIYDYDNYLNGELPVESYSYYGNLVLGKAVCQGYANTMKLMFDLAGLENIIVVGESYTNGNWGNHTWNIVKIDNEFYHVDATFDDPVTQSTEQILRHTYFNITDDEISLDHRWEINNYPSCFSTSAKYIN